MPQKKILGKKGNVALMYALLTMGIVLLGLFIVFGIVGSGILQQSTTALPVTAGTDAAYIRTNASSNLLSSQSTVNMTAMVILFGVMIGALLGYIYIKRQ